METRIAAGTALTSVARGGSVCVGRARRTRVAARRGRIVGDASAVAAVESGLALHFACAVDAEGVSAWRYGAGDAAFTALGGIVVRHALVAALVESVGAFEVANTGIANRCAVRGRRAGRAVRATGVGVVADAGAETEILVAWAEAEASGNVARRAAWAVAGGVATHFALADGGFAEEAGRTAIVSAITRCSLTPTANANLADSAGFAAASTIRRVGLTVDAPAAAQNAVRRARVVHIVGTTRIGRCVTGH